MTNRFLQLALICFQVLGVELFAANGLPIMVYRSSGDFSTQFVYLTESLALKKGTAIRPNFSLTEYSLVEAEWKSHPDLISSTGDQISRVFVKKIIQITLSKDFEYLRGSFVIREQANTSTMQFLIHVQSQKCIIDQDLSSAFSRLKLTDDDFMQQFSADSFFDFLRYYAPKKEVMN